MIKARPEDFVVEEKADLPSTAEGPYRVYTLRKSRWTTDDLLKHLARTLGISPEAISYGGRKDKHGLTSQFITIRDGRDFSRKGTNFCLESEGFMDRPMGPNLIRANAFRITIRDLEETDALARSLAEVRTFGVPNYFDDQRFRSTDLERGFFAEKILRRHWNGAIQVFLTSIPPGASGRERVRRTALFERWKDWAACLDLARNPVEEKIFRYLRDHPRDFVKAIHLVPEDEVAMQYAVYQSHLWNEVLRRLVKREIGEAEVVPGAAGPYLLWRTLDDRTRAFFADLAIPTAAPKMDLGDDRLRPCYEEVFRDAQIGPSAFRTKALRNVYFKSFPRRALVVPENVETLAAGPDDLNPGRQAFTLSFELPRGSYATIVVKRLTLPPPA